MWCISDGGAGLYHYPCTFSIYEWVNCYFVIINLQSFTRLNPFSNFLKVDICDSFFLLDYILYFASPVCRPMFRQDSTKYILYRIIYMMRSVLPAMMVSPKCQPYRITILDPSPQLFHLLGYEFLLFLVGQAFSISSSTCVNFDLYVIIQYIVSILSPLTLILIFQETSDIFICGCQYLLQTDHKIFLNVSLMCQV